MYKFTTLYHVLVDPAIIQHITGTLIRVACVTRPTLQLALQLISKHQNTHVMQI